MSFPRYFTQETKLCDKVSAGLKSIYKRKLLPLEEHYKFHDFHSPILRDGDFDAKPMILLIGQYSTGKTTFIMNLLQQKYPGMRIGPEPTTDGFMAVMYGEEEMIIPGNALAVDSERQFQGLSKFGNVFLNRLQCSLIKNDVLKEVSFIDSPGILSGEKERINRGYCLTDVLGWFAERVDRIILLFDAHKLDISDEFKHGIEAIKEHDEKIRIVLNKADMVSHQQLMRVYGALMWSLGKVLHTPEVTRVYIGSFWDKPLSHTDNRCLFEAERQDLLNDLQSLPRSAALRKINDFVKRARLAKAHAYVVSTLRSQMPSVFRKERKKLELIRNLKNVFEQVHKQYQVPLGDFPNAGKLQHQLKGYDFKKFRALKPKLITDLESMLSFDIVKLIGAIPRTDAGMREAGQAGIIHAGAFCTIDSPFDVNGEIGVNEGIHDEEWVVQKHKEAYDKIFSQMLPTNGKITGASAKVQMLKSKLPNSVLGKIWNLSDIDHDGMLDQDEWALVNFLIKICLDGYPLPNTLPAHLVPPSKRLNSNYSFEHNFSLASESICSCDAVAVDKYSD